MPLQPERLILASSSPRRSELLAHAGYQYEVISPDDSAECGVCSGETPPEFVARQAFQKAQNVAEKYSEGLFIGSDTVAEVRGQILGKPKNRDHAKQMLETMSGQEHRVFSGLCLWNRPDDDKKIRVAVTKLKMDQLQSAQLEEYLESGDWEGKAGAFGYQDGLDWVHIVEGSESNVVGLPMELLAELMTDFLPTNE